MLPAALLGLCLLLGLTQSEADAEVAKVVPELTAIRGLTFRSKVPVTVIDDKKAREYALTRFRHMMPESKIRADQTAFRLLGLVPKDTDLLKTLLDVLEEQAGGFYDPGTKSFYLLDDMPADMTPLLTAHEMTHALEDQRYGLDARIEKLVDDDDASFALSALIEGSATLAAAAYVTSAVGSGALDAERLAAVGETVSTERLDAMPVSLRRQLLGPYVLGLTFLSRGEALPGAFPKADIDAAWSRPPKSSEQILHPEKYWDKKRRDDPKRVLIPSPSKALGEGWTRSGSGILGELSLGSLVGAQTPAGADLLMGRSSWTNAAASGWGGDRFEVWTRGDGSVVLLATVWDTAKDAAEFEAALPKQREGFSFRRAGDRVGIVAGPAGDRREALLALLVAP